MSVLLSSGRFIFDLSLLSVPSIGGIGWAFELHYLSGTDTNSIVGPGFNFTSNLRLAEVVGGVDLLTGNNTSERFSEVSPGVFEPVAENNGRATLTLAGSGINEEFTLTSKAGVVSKFFGFDGAIATPGRLKQIMDRFGNQQSYLWQLSGTLDQLLSVTDSYGRVVNYRYYGSESSYRVREIEDFLGRKLNFQYDAAGHLVSVVTPSLLRSAPGNAFPGGTAYVFQYDVDNPRAERRDDLIRVWYPNQATSYIDPATRTIDVEEVYQNANPRYFVEYGQDPTDSDLWGRVIRETVGNPTEGVGGTYSYLYSTDPSVLPVNILDPDDPVVLRTVMTDRNGNQTIYDFNDAQMPVRFEALKTRSKNSLEASSYITWTQFNINNQPLLVVMPEGNSVEYEYETGMVTGIGDYPKRKGLLLRQTRKPGNPYQTSNANFPLDPTNPDFLIPAPRDGSNNGQTELTQRFFYDPIFNQRYVTIEARGNPVAFGSTYFPPQNGGTTPTDADRSRYATIKYFDYQKNTLSTVKNDPDLQALLGLSAADIEDLIDYVDDQLTDTGGSGGIPAGFELDLGDVNGDGTGDGASSGLPQAKMLGNVVKVKHPSVRLIGSASITTQVREELFTNNDRGQPTTHTDPEGNLTVYVRYPFADPEGDGQDTTPGLSNKQYGYLKEVHVDANPDDVLSLVGSDGDLVDFIPGIIARTNTPDVYQDLVTRYEGGGSSGCSSCAYDALGNPLATTDPRGFTTRFERNEMGEVYRTISPQPYLFQVETLRDANRNVTRIDTEDKVVQCDSNDPTSACYAQFSPSGSGGTAHVPMMAGPGGNVRPGWFTNLYTFDLLNNLIEADTDATGSSPSSLVTTFEYDLNQNLIKITKPEGNTIEYDYNERNLQIAQRVGYDPDNSQPGAVTVRAYDKNGNLLQAIGPAARGGVGNHETVIIEDAFRSALPLTHTGDYVLENVYDGFDRVISAIDAVGNVVDQDGPDLANACLDPNGRSIKVIQQGPIGGATPTNRTGSTNVDLSVSYARFDEAGRQYEAQQDVFLATGTTLPSSRAVTHTGGGLEANTVDNDHTGTVTLTTGGSSYMVIRTVYDRAGRTIETVQDNTAVMETKYDGGSRSIQTVDALENQIDTQFDANGNETLITRTEKCTITGFAIANEIFRTAKAYDSLNKLVVQFEQGADGELSTEFGSCGSESAEPSSLRTRWGYDSRGNATLMIDPKGNGTISVFDGTSRQIRIDQHLRENGQGNLPPLANTTFMPSGGAAISTRTFYDGNGRIKQLVDDRGGITAFTYDTLDRQLRLIFHDGSERVNEYDEARDVVLYTDESGSEFTSTFDALGRKTAVAISLASGVIGTTAQAFEYDGLSRSTFLRDSISSTHADVTLIYDSLGRILEDSQAYGGNTRNVTNSAFTSTPVTKFTFPNNRQITNTYDLLYRRRLLEETSNGVDLAIWEFFGPTRQAEVRLWNELIVTWMNNARNRSARQEGLSTPSWGNQSSDRLGYDGAGRMIEKRVITGTAGIGYGNTNAILGWTTEFDKGSNKLYERMLHAESRSHLYEPIVATEPQGGYDSLNRLRQYQRGTLASGGGSVSGVIALPNTDEFRTYDLDGLGNWRKTVYEPVGGSETTQVRQHNYLNEITRTRIASTNTDFLYDGIPGASNGNLINDSVRTYEWDALNRLKKVYKTPSSPSLMGEYTYDALGRRIRKVVTNGGLSGTISNGTTDYLYNTQWQCVEERNGSNTIIKQYIWGVYIDELIHLKIQDPQGPSVSTGQYFPQQDLLYRTAAIFPDDDFAPDEVYDYDAYGNTLIFNAPGTGSNWWANDASQSDIANCEALFTGQRYDSESELYLYRHRMYAPDLGRFLSRDNMSFVAADIPTAKVAISASVLDSGVLIYNTLDADNRVFPANAFNYVLSSPTVSIDPSGLIPIPGTPFDIPIPVPAPVMVIVGRHGNFCGLGNPTLWDPEKDPCAGTNAPKNPRVPADPIDDLDAICLKHDCCLYPADVYMTLRAQFSCNLQTCLEIQRPGLCDRSPNRRTCLAFLGYLRESCSTLRDLLRRIPDKPVACRFNSNSGAVDGVQAA